MAQQRTRWRPDTCEFGCILVYAWDDDALPTPEHTLAAYEAKCPAHAALADADAYQAVLDENRRKNVAVNVLMETFPEKYAEVGKDGVRMPTSDVLSKWSFDADRNVVIDTEDLSKIERAQYEAALTASPLIDETAVAVKG